MNRLIANILMLNCYDLIVWSFLTLNYLYKVWIEDFNYIILNNKKLKAKIKMFKVNRRFILTLTATLFVLFSLAHVSSARSFHLSELLNKAHRMPASLCFEPVNIQSIDDCNIYHYITLDCMFYLNLIILFYFISQLAVSNKRSHL